jgi:hypothetical protein
MSTLRSTLLVAIPVLAAVLVGVATYMIVSGGDDPPDLNKIQVEEGRVSCEMFEIARGYRYDTVVVYDLKDRPEDMEPTDPYGPEGLLFTNIIEGDVQSAEAIHLTIELPENEQSQEWVVLGDEELYQSVNGAQWQSLNPGEYQVPYVPGAACNALAPDLFLSSMEGTSEMVNEIPATKYHFDALESDFPDRHPSFGAQSDMAVYVNTFAGDVWVAEEGGYIVKMDLVGVGHYENGRELRLEYSYELSDVNANIKIKAPI